ncbi:MAG TPA: 4Fe-4S dicluster domain-containing protein [Thermoplasmatales archaeon]|nr:4Fe-4S dicluster domain-containing protein [Thermoplasmatales archaeon]
MKRWEKEGIVEITDLSLPDKKHLKKGVAIIECVQEIPCNPCVDACPFNAISMENINALPLIDYEKCVGCGKCVGVCPGLAIFVIKIIGDNALLTLPYEFVPLPEEGQIVKALDREGKEICNAVVKKLKFGKTPVVTVELPAEYAMEARNIKVV